MGKKSRDKQEKREARHAEPEAAAEGTGEKGISRRSAIRLSLAAAGLATASGGAYYFATRNDEGAHPDPRYLSREETAKMYADIRTELAAQLKKAQALKLPLKVFIAEDHDARGSLLQEYLIVKAAQSLGIGQAELENRPGNRQALEQDAVKILAEKHQLNETGYNGYPARRPSNMELLYPILKESGLEPVMIDNAYATTADMHKGWAESYKQALNDRLRTTLALNRDPIAEVGVTVNPDGMLNPRPRFYQDAEYLIAPNRPTIDAAIKDTLPETDKKIIVDTREAAMIRSMSNRDSIVITGGEHVQALAESRKDTALPLVLNASPPLPALPQPDLNVWTRTTASRQKWLEAQEKQLYTDKPPPPEENLKAFLDNAIALAVKKYKIPATPQDAKQRQ